MMIIIINSLYHWYYDFQDGSTGSASRVGVNSGSRLELKSNMTSVCPSRREKG